MDLPKSLFEWTSLFNDDQGFEPMESGLPTDEKPGSAEKVAVLRERLIRGQHLWCEEDAGASESAIGVRFKQAGGRDYGAIIGEDDNGHRHRYAIWTSLPSKRDKPLLLQYVPAFASYVDCFQRDPELSAIKRHAMMQGATSVAVTPLFSARIRTERDFARILDPITSAGLLWIRLFAKNVDKIVACWGETTMYARHLDVGWTLCRTQSRVYSTEEGNEWPPMITRYSTAELFRYDFYEHRAKFADYFEDD